MNHLLNILDGFVSILHWGPQNNRRYTRVCNGFARDQMHLRQDVKAVGNGLRKVTRVYGEQSRSRARIEQRR